MNQFGTFVGLAFSALLPLINPVGDALVFLGLVGAAPSDVYRTLARKQRHLGGNTVRCNTVAPM